MSESPKTGGPHQGQPILAAGVPLGQARALMIMVHGRGASAEDILSLSEEFSDPEGLAFLAPEAAGHAWYPNSFLTSLEGNEPGISSGMAVLAGIEDSARKAGIPAERIMLLGFSQGACLVLEYAARQARRFGGIAGLSGGLIGPDSTPRDYEGSMEGTPIFLGCSLRDPHIPAPRVRLTEQVFRSLGAEVTMRLYPEPGHTINEDEVDHVRLMITSLSGR